MAEFFVGDRAIPWWLAATSMAATTFNVDTPLYVAGRVARAGIAGNWEWWCFAFSHVLLAVLLAKLWRRASVVTDLELTELRYGGAPAAFPVMLLTPPERPEVLEGFYRRVRPDGAWGPQQRATGLTPLDDLKTDLTRWLVWSAALLGVMLGAGDLLLGWG
jgi:sodium:solute symporter family protein